MRVRIDRIVVHGALEVPDAQALDVALRIELARALHDVAEPAHPRPVPLVWSTAPPHAALAPSVAAAVRSALGGPA